MLMRAIAAVVALAFIAFSITTFAPLSVAQQADAPSASQRPSVTQLSSTTKPPAPKEDISFANDRLSVNVQRRSLTRLVEEISDRVGIPVMLSGNLSRQVISVKFQNLPLEQALRQIFAKHDSFLFYGVDEQGLSRLRAVWVYPK